MANTCTREPMVVGFADLTRFLAAASAMEDLEMAEALQAHYDRLGEILARHSGRVVKCIGDALLFCFPAGAEADAVAAAREMVAAAETTAREMRCPDMRLAVGIAAGDVVAGDLGPAGARRFDLLGDPVNTAALICAPGICVSRSVRDALGEDAEALEPIRRAGREFEVYRVS